MSSTAKGRDDQAAARFIHHLQIGGRGHTHQQHHGKRRRRNDPALKGFLRHHGLEFSFELNLYPPMIVAARFIARARSPPDALQIS